MLIKQYNKVQTEPKADSKVEDPHDFFRDSDNKDKIDNVFFNLEDVRDAIDKLSPRASAGPDGVPAILLKKCKENISIPLQIIFKKSLETGEIPDIMKLAHITPILKPGKLRTKPESYRPVSLTSHIMKTFERIIKKSLQNHLELTKQLNQNQHGFRSQRSCLTQLLAHYDEILKGIEEGFNVDTIYLDFSKAFDKVDKGVLCHKLRQLGIHGPLGVWLHNFLTNRKQTVIANGSKSSTASIISGVPQGTVLGPLLFLILINDIDEKISQSNVNIFADDTRIKKVIKTEDDSTKLQEELNKLYDWEKTNNMEFNGSKFEVLKCGSKKTLKENTKYYSPDNKEIDEKESLRDLGIIMNNEANFKDHINKVCAQVTQKSGWVLRTFSNRKSWFMKQMWKTLIQGHIYYCSQLYQPTQSQELTRIENLQRKYTKRIPQVRNLNYWERIKQLKIISQQRRYERYRIIYMWKILEGKAPNCGIEENSNKEKGRKIKIPTLKSKARTIRESSFQVHGARLFNSLPLEIRNQKKCSVEDFKTKLDTFLSKIPDQPKIGDLIPPAQNINTGNHSNSIVDQVRYLRSPWS